MDNNTYIKILHDTIVKKNNLLDKLILLSEQQEIVLQDSVMNDEKFNNCITEKSVLIDELNQLDSGFETLYNRIRDDLVSNPGLFRSQIEVIQEQIKEIILKTSKLQVLEKKNKTSMDLYLAQQKCELRNMKMTNKIAASYHNSMSWNGNDQSYFLDKKK